MNKKNRFLQTLFRPRGAVLVIVYFLTAVFVAGAIVSVALNRFRMPVALSYILFGLSALFLAYSIYTVVLYAPAAKQKFRLLLLRNDFTARIMQHYGFKTFVFALFSLAINVAFAVMNLVSAVLYKSVWYASVAGYYSALIVFRGGVIIADNKCKKKFADNDAAREKSKWKIYLAGGAFLIVVACAMAGAVTQMTVSARPVRSGQVMAIANAAYTFIKMTTAIYNLCRARKFDDPVTQALRNLNFSAACMSVVSLTVLMIATFAANADEMNGMLSMKACVGFIACALVLATATIMIRKATKELRKTKTE